ncbi:ABC transporter G family member 24 isoform X2 [Neltuma alba]|uniref:ABC transporter G family member 24 isoform X2 n=1 Tax=Neltuma alba TaxID=207710 RepID=UPI0010A38857|nr:ABC transporter G family member 24-like isoform X2 [Prosopis alba]
MLWSWLAIVVLTLSSLNLVQCQVNSGPNPFGDSSGALPFMTQLVNAQLSNLTRDLSKEIKSQSSFCVKDPEAEWNKAFNFSSDLSFLTSCIQKTQDITRRFCTVAEVKSYFRSITEKIGSTSYLKPNRNCNLTSWGSGCEPGWACSTDPDQQVDLRTSQDIPARTTSCQACCEGFFCPQGLTCMIPCPLGSYCPLATLNRTSGLCEPYQYRLPANQPNHTCGGANIWADVDNSEEVFCPAGSYCPSTTKKIPCSNGNYCRMGSTSEKRCYNLVPCKSGTESQNLHVYGIMFIVGLSTLLLVIYSCSDQVLSIRERRLAKSRDAAARSVKSSAQARRRWKDAKDSVTRHASRLQSHLSFSFSHQKNIAHSEELQILNQVIPEADGDLLSPLPPNASRATLDSRNQIETGHEIENESIVHDEFDMEDGHRVVTANSSKGKKLHARSKIFRHAYSQLEKEKARQQEYKNLTFSGVISMASNSEQRKRPLIEISFKDLSLILKSQNKYILRCVTGNIKPGHITAVMGPSGAGKTTFLSALAGKALGCKKSGLILINGKNESIHSYKKIIGFVPQDDIVHGNLTVEENLWFSANCRLSAESSKADKVVVVERVIEFLGLHSVRNSLVGTVEKRGISGGQRKRVNVGLEMVMEPSLLILDEPTSGLDSASSQLLLRALRREALEGVNVCMVVHQPSHTLFKMFDDLVLLAKGGLTVYHGPVNRVEEYFAGLGIFIPERINPPDYFIDILEGVIKPSGRSGVKYDELAVRWMLHNGYSVPPDMQKSNMPSRLLNPINETNNDDAVNEEPSFTGELWKDVKGNIEMHQEKLRLNFLKSKDLSNRRTASLFWQYKYFLARVAKQRLRDAKAQAIDYLILLLAGACLGSVIKMRDQSLGAAGYTYTVIAVSLLCKIAALRSFSLEKLQYWRESASGMSSLAYFLSRDTIDHFNTVIKPAVYLSMFFFFTNPRSTFVDNYTVLLCLVYCVTGMGYALAIVFEPGAAQLWSVLLPVVLTLVATQPRDSEFMKRISDVCYTKWALQAFVIANAERYDKVWLITRCGALKTNDYNLSDWSLCISILILFGVVSRAIAFICMLTFRRK